MIQVKLRDDFLRIKYNYEEIPSFALCLQARKEFIGTTVTRTNLMWKEHAGALLGDGGFV